MIATKRAPVIAALALLATTASLPAEAAASRTVSVVVFDWNILGESADIPAMAKVIRDSGANVVTLQEVHRRPGADQVRQLADALGWDITANAHFGVGDDVGPCDAPEEGKAGNAILSSFRIVERVTIPLSNFATCPVNRSMAGAKLDLGGGAQVTVFTTHLSPGLSATSVSRREAQATKIRDYLGTRTGVVLTGDFNALPTDPLSKSFVSAGWTDTGARYANKPTHGTARIDYVYTRGVTTTSGSVLSSTLSDHRPIVMRMTR
ncbi:Metal-dependent hydrolase, endonuclease/exonuclease/phosphatase family [Nonomuraea solani]|uniref:Metal-dependent hydrolase, endonuclease/exonuclease/phosphatase family n=1 Tax=Nonomuraea solani TaxID=1144553 RepID=A0A1H5TWJ1_9ACTN|nr:endonuclease/exonuclease/phosphatase family protein [Nonomuraea solani]SEF67120.1 Metal-dependent hydrolase, endonuclease/exonuclease/phosphatase family [Nonomuraea solani]